MSTILIVDDDPNLREALAESLQSKGYDIAVANNGAEALDWLHKSDAPGLILLDLMMPIMDGHEFLARRKHEPSLADIPVVVITAGWHPGGSGVPEAAEVLYKPFGTDKLMNAVQQHCR